MEWLILAVGVVLMALAGKKTGLFVYPDPTMNILYGYFVGFVWIGLLARLFFLPFKRNRFFDSIVLVHRLACITFLGVLLVWRIFFLWGINNTPKGILVFFIGGCLNCIVFLANKFKMPVKERGERIIGSLHCEADANTKLSFLCDIIRIPRIGLSSFSIGDALVMMSFYIFFVESLFKR